MLDMLAAHRSYLLLQVEMGHYDNRLKCTYKNRSRKLPQAPLSPVNAPNRPAKRKQWSGEQMTAPMEAVTDRTAVSINQAAREYGVPASTLKDHLSCRVVHGTKPGPVSYLRLIWQCISRRSLLREVFCVHLLSVMVGGNDFLRGILEFHFDLGMQLLMLDSFMDVSLLDSLTSRLQVLENPCLQCY